MIVALLIFTLVYVVVLFRLSRGLSRLPEGDNTTNYRVSIVVAAHNEAAYIENCLRALLAQNYPTDLIEIIIVDDRSTDKTASLVKRISRQHPHIRLLQITHVSPDMAPKKHAIETGVRQASGEIICITDADTQPAPGWVNSMIQQFGPEVGFVAGFAPLNRSQRKDIFFQLIRLDSLALAAVAAGSIGAGFPMTCTARSIAYRRKVFDQVGGFRKIARFISGDDDLFMHLVRDDTNWHIRYAASADGYVSSVAVTSFREFVHQRIRHASKGGHYSLRMKAVLSAIYLYNTMLFFWPMASWFQPYLLPYGLGSLVIKTVADFSVVYQFARKVKATSYIRCFPVAVFFHIPYVVVFGLLGIFGKFRWKGNAYSSTVRTVS